MKYIRIHKFPNWLMKIVNKMNWYYGNIRYINGKHYKYKVWYIRGKISNEDHCAEFIPKNNPFKIYKKLRK